MKERFAGFNKLWAPWRMKYVSGIDDKKDDGCIFCTKPGENDDDNNFIVARFETCFLILNIFPYNNGHVMVVPYKHTADMSELTQEERLDLMNSVDLTIRALKEIMNPDGFNVGINFGRSAGAGIDQHMHVHIVPRWNGDTNFMPVIGCTKVICEAPDETYRKLKPVVARLLEEG